MDNHEFDSALRDYVKSSELPYDASQWYKMSARLKAHEEKKIVPVVTRSIPVYKWATVAAAACLLVMLGWYIKGLETKSDYGTSNVPIATNNTTVNATGITEPQAAETTPGSTKNETIAQTPANPAIYRRSIQTNESTNAPTSVIAALQTADTLVSNTQEARSTVANTPVNKRLETESDIPPAYAIELIDELPQQERKMAYGINGGYNLGAGSGNYTVGVNVRRKLSKRVLLETGIAFVSGSNNTYEKHLTEQSIPGTLDVQKVQTYEPVKNNLFYVQAAPSISYELLPGFSAGGGADAQRLLNKASESISINSLGAQEESQPQWDFGLTARMDYQVFKKLKAGIMYRESVGAISKNATNTAKRNYMLMQLSYTIF
jgi:hypothetical protein